MKTPVFSSAEARCSTRSTTACETYSPSSASFGVRSTSELDERVLGREHEEGRAEEGVRPRREDRDVDVELVDAEEQLGALGAADPVALDRVVRAGQSSSVVVVEQRVGVGGDPEEPLLQLAHLDPAPQRSQWPSTTCSFASTVWSFGHQLTGASLR